MPPAKKRKGKNEGDGGAGKKRPRSTLGGRDIDHLNRKFPGFTFRAPTAEETPGTWIDEELCIFIEFFKDGPLLPLPEFLVTFCRQFKLVPAMLMPNTLIVLRGLHSFYSAWTVPWNKESIMSLITFTLKEPGCFYAQPKYASEFKMVGIPSSRHGWKEKYAFVRSSVRWPICTIPEVPHADAYKGCGITKRLAYILKSHGSPPFCVNMDTLEILPAKEEGDQKAAESAPKKKRKVGDALVSKIIKAAIASEEQTATGDSEEEEESNIRWSDETATAAPTKKVISKHRKLPGIVIKETSTTPTAHKAEETGSLKGKEKVVEPEPAPGSSSDTLKIAAEIAEGMGTFTGEDIGASTAEKPEEHRVNGEWEWYHIKDDEEFAMKKNSRYRFIPKLDTSGLPLLLPSLLKHPEDDKLLNNMSILDVGALQTHISFTNLILGQCLTERAMVAGHELNDCKIELVEVHELASMHKQLAQRYKSESDILGSTVQSQDREHKEVVAAFKANEAIATDELKKARAEVDRLQQLQKATEERLQQERAAAAADRAGMQARIAELERALAQKEKSQSADTASVQNLIEEYKDSDEYQYELKDVGLYGFNLLKKVLVQEKKLSLAELNSYDYDNCLLAEDDEDMPP